MPPCPRARSSSTSQSCSSWSTISPGGMLRPRPRLSWSVCSSAMCCRSPWCSSIAGSRPAHRVCELRGHRSGRGCDQRRRHGLRRQNLGRALPHRQVRGGRLYLRLEFRWRAASFFSSNAARIECHCHALQRQQQKIAVIAGAGPAGLTAALELLRRSEITPIVIEADGQVGGISKTINYRGNRMDLGGHRFFSKSDWVMRWWQEILPVADGAAQPIGRAAHPLPGPIARSDARGDWRRPPPTPSCWFASVFREFSIGAGFSTTR